MLQDQVCLMQSCKGLLLRVDLALQLDHFLLVAPDLSSQLGNNLVFVDDYVFELCLLLVVFRFVSVRHFVDKHLPVVFVAFLKELLIDTKCTNDYVFLLLGALAAVLKNLVEAHSVDIQCFLQSQDLLLCQTSSAQALVVKPVLLRGRLRFFDFLNS